MGVCTGPLELVAPPTGHVLSLGEAKAQCRQDIADEDAEFYGLIDRATTFCEQEVYGHRQFMQATFSLPLEGWWGCPLHLPRPPLLWIDAVTYYDTAGVLQTLAASSYLVRTPWKQPGTIEWAPSQTGPALESDRRFPVLVKFTAGFAQTFTASMSANTITVAGRTFANGDLVRLSCSRDGALPAPLVERRNYYVVGASSETCQLALTSGGAAIDLTTEGTGELHVGEVPGTVKQAVRMILGHWFKNREDVLTGTISKEIERASANLLASEGWGSYR